MRIDPIASHGNEVSIYCGTDNGARNFTLNADTRIVEEKKVPDQLTYLKNVYDIQFVDEEVYFASENGTITYLMLNRVTLDQFEIDGSSAVQSLGMIGRSGGNVLIALSEDSSKILIYGYKILNEQFELID